MKSRVENMRIITPDGEALLSDIDRFEIDLDAGTVTVVIRGNCCRYPIEEVTIEILPAESLNGGNQNA